MVSRHRLISGICYEIEKEIIVCSLGQTAFFHVVVRAGSFSRPPARCRTVIYNQTVMHWINSDQKHPSWSVIVIRRVTRKHFEDFTRLEGHWIWSEFDTCMVTDLYGGVWIRSLWIRHWTESHFESQASLDANIIVLWIAFIYFQFNAKEYFHSIESILHIFWSVVFLPIGIRKISHDLNFTRTH